MESIDRALEACVQELARVREGPHSSRLRHELQIARQALEGVKSTITSGSIPERRYRGLIFAHYISDQETTVIDEQLKEDVLRIEYAYKDL